MHFFSPVPVMPLIELIRGRDTSDETVATLNDLSAELGKQVIVSADRPGFIVNRILMPFLGEAMRAYEEGLGTADDIDTGARIGLNHPMGPLELADFIGLDVCLGIMRVLDDGLGGDHFRPPPGPRRPGRGGQARPEDRRGLPHLSEAGTPRRAGRGMSGGLTEEERLLQATAREFATREVAPTAIERDEAERYDRSLFARMGELGLTAAPLPESIGGAGFSYLGWTLVMEELGAADMAIAVSLSVHILSQYPVVTWGTPEQQERWLPAMLAGEALGAFALTEPHAGCDAAAIRTRAEAVGPADAPTRVPADRDEDLDLQRARGGAVPRVRDARSDGRRQGHHGVPGREGDRRVPVRGARAEDGDPRLPGGGARVRRRRGPGREPSRRRRARATGSRCRRSVRAGSRSPPRASGSPGPALEAAARYLSSGRPSARRWPSSRACASCSPRWPARSRPRGR